MNNEGHISEAFLNRSYCSLLSSLYGKKAISESRQRYIMAMDRFKEHYGDEPIEIFSAPGRVEIGGNHTDHNNGRVLAGSINLDCLGVASCNRQNKISIISEQFDVDSVIDLDTLRSSQENSTVELVRGLVEGMRVFGYKVGGFDLYTTSNVISAAGVSSSAAFEMLLCTIINDFYNDSVLTSVDYARVGQYAENHRWNKASGLLDQIASAHGGLISIDFEEINNPIISTVETDLFASQYDLVVVNTGKGHADLSREYTSIPEEMKAIASYFHKNVLREISEHDIVRNIHALRASMGDRAILRAMHFFEENDRVTHEIQALENNNYEEFKDLILKSGISSWELLQNAYSVTNLDDQGIPLALALTRIYMDDNSINGAWRLHGGGFAGVILTILPKSETERYCSFIESAFQTECAYPLVIRPFGAINVSRIADSMQTI